jgi:alkanesulfonate monooxygenase SsuD/methylene tetrahydromethanopterin reductase-like flavin-dependent oxidoreductase (luciferase family)
MQYGMSIPPFGDLADPRALADFARVAEAAGWDGFFIWDHMIWNPTFHPMVDPWVGLSAVAVSTQRMRLGTMITPVARRRPWKLARETVSLDRLSNGRLILGVGLGDPAQWEFGFFGEETEASVRAKRLDEGLAILNGLWSGAPFSFQGEQYTLHEVAFRPRPLQAPRIPIWVGGGWPHKRPLRRAAQWDGACCIGQWEAILTPDVWRAIAASIASYRTTDEPFDLVHIGRSTGIDHAADVALVATYAEAGVTWWIEDISPWRFGWKWEDAWSPEATALMTQRVQQGPPRP